MKIEKLNKSARIVPSGKLIFVIVMILILSYLFFLSAKKPSKPIDFAIEWFDNNGYGEAECRAYEKSIVSIQNNIYQLSKSCRKINESTHAFFYDQCKRCGNNPVACSEIPQPIIFTNGTEMLGVYKPPPNGFEVQYIDKGLLIYCHG